MMKRILTPALSAHCDPRALDGSCEELCRESGVPSFFLPLGAGQWLDVRAAISEPKLERAIGVIYKPETEFQSHYFRASLPRQFDEYCFIQQTTAVASFRTEEVKAFPDLYPFGL